MRPFKIGLSRPKAKKKDAVKPDEGATSKISTSKSTDDKMATSEVDEINASRETIEDISDSHLRRAVKVELKSVLEHSIDEPSEVEVEDEIASPSILDLVDKISKNNETVQLGAAEVYDLQNDYLPEAGPSKIHNSNAISHPDVSFINNSDSSLEENNTGIMSFYTSKVFNLSPEGDIPDSKLVESHEIKIQIENFDQNELTEDVETNTHVRADKLKVADYSLKILTPLLKPPTKSYIAATLDQYKIPKIVYPEPYYSDHKDVGAKVEIGQLVLKLHSRLARDQKPFEKVTETSLEEWRYLLFMQTNEMYEESAKPAALRTLLAGNKTCILEPVKRPPTSKDIKQWIEDKAKGTVVESKIDDISKNIEELDNSQALGLHEDVTNSCFSLESNDKVILIMGLSGMFVADFIYLFR